MGFKKKEKVLPKIAPGSEIVVPCVGCGTEKLTLKPSSKSILPGKVEFTCAACAGIGTKWKMPSENSEKAGYRAEGQTKLFSAVVQKVEVD